MGLYDDHVLPRLIDRACGIGVTSPLRQRVCAGLAGEVLEIGFGSGLNVAHYPARVRHVTAVEPADLAWRLAGHRVRASAVPIERAGLDGQSLPLPDAVFDTAVSSWTLCTIPDAAAALAEVRRVLRPGGTFHFVEHGLSAEPRVARWQRRLEPVQKRVAGGCHLTRHIADLVAEAGLRLREVETFDQHGVPRVLGATTLGVAER
ncbi:class I SAM-dependent methyltransferase [Nocardioides sp. zg-536]|uniref:Class I SAM-dependent methyltransferase n=1 Tax=Nocardioides faecalis TaxID=2803858 RepID=A0A938Y3Q3_9ACTN|nr:class I SAM-dependent methyltransferase [Nocardioides faecalis]MBM9458675.1 class I SAM-dependent methyltransferase [Nocardioides faecalis]MBS4753009.1 class I SAM-dependent methyltransferase [Nocardioides faecalis]QVI58668.1 class I SAM-dependent methyltransferase [Nocardioides faecalis]